MITREDIIEIMRDAACKLAERLHLLALMKLRLDLLALRMNWPI